MRLLKYSVLAVIVLAVVAGGVAWHLAHQPIQLEPFVRHLPADNAYDDYVEAAKPVKISDYAWQNPDDLRAAEAAVRRNSEALAAARRAFKKDCAVPWEPGTEIQFPALASVRRLGQAFWWEGHTAELRRDYASAAGSYLDALRLGAETSRDGLLIHALVARAIGSIGLSALEGAVPHLSADDCKLALLQLREIERRESSMAQILDNERIYSIARLSRKQSLAPYFVNIGHPRIANFVKANFTPKRWLTARLDKYLAEQTARARLPIYERPALSEPRDPFLSMFAGPFSRAFRPTDRTRAQREVVKGMLAIQGFRSKYGRLPKKLEDVAPEFLPKTPIDPYTGKPLAYKLTPDGYLLYSFGPDQDDDGGAPLKRDETSGDLPAGKLFKFAD